MANGNILAQIEKQIDELLEKDSSSKEMLRGVLQIQRLTIPYFQQSHDDHTKVTVMWNTYKIVGWGMGVGFTLVSGLLFGIFTGQIQLSFP